MVCANLSLQDLQLLYEEAEWISGKLLYQLRGQVLRTKRQDEKDEVRKRKAAVTLATSQRKELTHHTHFQNGGYLMFAQVHLDADLACLDVSGITGYINLCRH